MACQVSPIATTRDSSAPPALGPAPRPPRLAFPRRDPPWLNDGLGSDSLTCGSSASRGLRRERGGGDNERASIRAVVASDVTYALSDNVWRRGLSSAIEPWRQTPKVSDFRVSHPSMILRLTSCLTEMAQQWQQTPDVSAHIGSPLPFGPEVRWGWRQTPDVSTHNGLPLPWKGVNCGWRSALPGQTRGLHGVRRRPSSPGRSHRASAATEIAPLGKVAGCRQRIPLASPCESFSSNA